ncbi:indolepyruvate ferredoxin oxidoreductase subunit alpha [Deferribacter abyssi]|uniref:indolepyruvate ferredoxin oxidoreductase subunit alpha n=1 Tax=Deferribacter abyssi TaxID=213806 RepID=UPI003C1AA7C8
MIDKKTIFHNTNEIVNKFINELRFEVIYKENLFPLEIDNTTLLPTLNSFKILISSALTGVKTIAFYHKIPDIKKIYLINSPFLIISRTLPDTIQLPTIFIKQINLLTKHLMIAYKLSSETKLPVNVVISPSILNNITKDVELEPEHTIIKPYLTLNNLISPTREELLEHFQLAETILNQEIKTHNVPDTISFYNNNYDFIPYLIPHIKNHYLINIEKIKIIKVFQNELYFFENLLHDYNFKIDLKIHPTHENVSVKKYLCPGCPFVSIKELLNNNLFIFSSIKCDIVSNMFNLKHLSFSEYYGLTLKSLQKDTIFIGNISEINHNLVNELKPHQRVILLLDTQNEAYISIPKIKKIKKLPQSNFIFPYSCENIPKQKPLTIKEKKCKCLSQNESPECIEKTNCPALFETDNKKISINSSLCVGCTYCKLFCRYGAIK